MHRRPDIKHDLTQKVFFLHKNKVCTGNVDRINTKTFTDAGAVITHVSYRINCSSGDIYTCMDQSTVFRNKEELLESL